MKNIVMVALVFVNCMATAEPVKNVYFGDTHLHSSYSFDAFLNNNHSADPDTAYRWAKGQPVIHPYNRARVQIDTPLDFLVVSDHAEMLGVMRAVHEDNFIKEDLGWIGNVKRWYSFWLMNRAIDSNTGLQFFSQFLPQNPTIEGHSDPVQHPDNNISDLAIFGDTSKTSTLAWHDIVETAERHNDPGIFTSLLGWEWSSIPMGANLHRIVISPDGAEKGKQFLPYGSDQSQYPEDLWQWLDETQKQTGARFLAIPHNSNISKGYMFDDTTLRGEPITAEYARRRMQWEPVVEATQIKGDSETRSDFSPEDEFADFENYDYYIQVGQKNDYKASAADYIRPALKRGLSIGQQVGVNPYKFGLIGSTDAHTGLSTSEEGNFWGKMASDSTPETKERLGAKIRSNGWNMSASGIAAVWAEENTREAIYAAFKRKEVYATSGPRLRVQMFAGWDFPGGAESSESFSAIGSQFGVPMGGDLTAGDNDGKAPVFLLRAVKDPLGANLDRLQVVKGWIDSAGQQQEKVYNVAWSDDRQLDASGNLSPVGNTVDLSSGRYDNSIGQPEFSLRWTDPDFGPQQSAFYYVRVLQIPTPRNGLLDSLALELDEPPRGAKTIQERAYSSPIWYQPQ
ncbi:DUF3604 domain-containing protein [Porticoccaceae bacterium]|nr:DUF3604 domain-containing protein [Porticoccaceae bacterium]MDB2383605.1 DUF3604 domain-containing protein [Porticoccaceae bacterium]MDB2565586.1 DUF3604 domain-containing protein [Porticoccaceae bacterium]